MKTTNRCYKKHYAKRTNHVPNDEIPERLDTYDWEQAFYYADGFTRQEVDEIIHIDEGENDSYDWILLARLNNGSFAGLSAGCDYTGWD